MSVIALATDLRAEIRAARRRTAWWCAVSLAIGLGVGGVTAMAAIVDSTIWRPLPYPDADDVFVMQVRSPVSTGRAGRMFYQPDEFRAYVAGVPAFAAVAAVTDGPRMALRGVGIDDTVRSALISGNSLKIIGVSPMIGRSLNDVDAASQPASTFLISHRLWARLHFDRGVIGRSFMLEGHVATLVGVLPPRCTIFGADVYTAVAVENASPSSEFYMWVRLRPGIEPAAAAEEFHRVARDVAPRYPEQYPKDFTISAVRLPDSLTGRLKGTLYGFAVAAVALLGIATANAVCLLIARRIEEAAQRAIYAALGADWRWRLRRAFAEMCVIAAPALACALVCAAVCVALAARLVPATTLPEDVTIGLDGLDVVGCAIVTLIVVSGALGLSGLAVRGQRLAAVFGRLEHGSSRRSGVVAWRALVGAQVALALVLATATMLVARTFVAISRVELGADVGGVVSAAVRLPAEHFTDPHVRRRLFHDVADALARRPGIAAVGTAAIAPVIGGMRTGLEVDGRETERGWTSLLQICSSTYFDVARSELRAGRLFSSEDDDAGRRVAVVNETMAERYFGSDGAIGKFVRVDRLGEGPSAIRRPVFEIVGVVEDERNHGIRNPALPEVFVPAGTAPGFGQVLLIRSSMSALATSERLRQVLRTIEPGAVVTSVEAVADMVDRAFYAEPRLNLGVIGMFAAVALLLVTVGVYGVAAYCVTAARKECAIRLALGATSGSIQRLVVVRMLRVVAGGLVGGMAIARLSVGLVPSGLWSAPTDDVTSFAASVMLVGGCALVAAYIPARMTSTQSLVSALRAE
jgi:putative ABC transport system permease protein